MTYEELQRNWANKTGLEIGDEVVIVFATPYLIDYGEMLGCDKNHQSWVQPMDEKVGRVFSVRDLTEAGVLLGDYYYPFFVLRPLALLKKVKEHGFEIMWNNNLGFQVTTPYDVVSLSKVNLLAEATKSQAINIRKVRNKLVINFDYLEFKKDE